MEWMNATLASNSSPSSSNEHTEVLLNSSFYCACIMIALCVVGVCGNSLSIYVFSRKSMRSSINVLLLGLSIIDFLLLIAIIPIFALPALNIHNSAWIAEFSQVMVVYGYPLSMMLQSASVWLFMLITTERYLAVVHPLRVGLYCSASRARLAIVTVVLAAVAYNFVRFWEYSLEDRWDAVEERRGFVTSRLLRKSTNYWLWYGTVLYLLTQFVMPFLLIAILNTKMVNTIVKAKKQRALLTMNEKSEHKTALMMALVVVIFVSCYTLSFVLNFIELIDASFFDREGTQALAYFLNDINNTLVTFNSASTFVIYVSFSRRYRFLAKWLVLSWCPIAILRHFMEPESIDAVKMAVYFGSRNGNNTSSVFLMKQSSRPSTGSCLRSGTPQEMLRGRRGSPYRNVSQIDGMTPRDNQLIIPLKEREFSMHSGCQDSGETVLHNLTTELVSISPIVPRSNR
uniref:G-protein coupled receptors family 1 profile domain-containing protein n=1 Tax=Plectus sambesii TaxID=2011161 RepID=A0A914W6Y9_9BILA